MIDGDPEAQRAIRFAMYHLISAANPGGERSSIGARCLTGTAYKGHVFWDTEIYMLPGASPSVEDHQAAGRRDAPPPLVGPLRAGSARRQFSLLRATDGARQLAEPVYPLIGGGATRRHGARAGLLSPDGCDRSGQQHGQRGRRCARRRARRIVASRGLRLCRSRVHRAGSTREAATTRRVAPASIHGEVARTAVPAVGLLHGNWSGSFARTTERPARAGRSGRRSSWRDYRAQISKSSTSRCPPPPCRSSAGQ
jgi:hypothetical protein